MEKLVSPAFWQGRRVFLTGHTGFKGAWMALWLQRLGATTYGYSLPPPTPDSLYETAEVAATLRETIADIRDLEQLQHAVCEAAPEIILHFAAQSLVRQSYQDPVGTLTTNVIGIAHVLEAVRHTRSVRAVIIVTSDKCYENREWPWPYRETDPMGGHDPYSASKGCAELVTAAWRRSFLAQTSTGVATARAGNVLGSGDFASDRLLPDLLAAFAANVPAQIRSPDAIRPWQHVIDPLAGYLLLAERLYAAPEQFSVAWNFGPDSDTSIPVRAVADCAARAWGPAASWITPPGNHPHEAHLLRVDSSLARQQLGWRPRIELQQGIEAAIAWHRSHRNNQDPAGQARAQLARFATLHEEPR